MLPQQVITFIIGTVAVLFGAYYVTYYIGKKASGQTRTGHRNRNISLLDRYAIARDKSFCVVEIAGKVYIVGVTNHTMTLLDTLDAAAFAKLTEDNREIVPWSMTPVGQYGNKLTKKLVAFIAEKTGKMPPADGGAPQAGGKSGGDGFAASLHEARRSADAPTENNQTGQPDDMETESPENPEDDRCL